MKLNSPEGDRESGLVCKDSAPSAALVGVPGDRVGPPAAAFLP